ncbi:hypothetical protein [Turneriella parva]|uniref:DUF4259 domain-containing protein n=1 Tax=Turneriella parva (strain ATCC BAA-1111 / DSM 21527 / NCTC 11395 / H) TaxID=869212 RepID=I4B9I7_TURPD|nr:hypothetical protein [Turneriella parva]AFM13944.1 hypothetical protein Turpa_3306 [Turneriella parva DSM 21527]
MGVWGTGIASNDVFKDIYGEFLDKFNQGAPVSEITKQISAAYSSLIDDPDESNELYFALAKAQWDCGSLDKAILEKVTDLINSGAELQRWQSLGASQAQLKKRETAMQDFLALIKEPNPKPRKPKPVKLVNAIFAKGDCLAIPLTDGRFGAALVLAAEEQTQFGLNLLVAVDFLSVDKPNVQDILKGRCLNRHLQDMQPSPDLQYCYAKDFKKSKYQMEKIGEIQFEKLFLPKNARSVYGRWDTFADAIASEKARNTNEPDALKISKFIKKTWF